jgi:hypothetical protein
LRHTRRQGSEKNGSASADATGLAVELLHLPHEEDAPEAVRQIIFVYESQGKTVEAAAWRTRLREIAPGPPSAQCRPAGKAH